MIRKSQSEFCRPATTRIPCSITTVVLPGEFEYTEHTKDFQNVEMQGQEMIMKELNMEILPEAAKRELFGFYEYLVDKYTKKGLG